MGEIFLDFNSIIKDLLEISSITIKNPLRKKHISNVLEYALMMADKYNTDKNSTKIAVLAHDIFRDLESEKLISLAKLYKIKLNPITLNYPILLHGPVAAEFCKRKYNINKFIYSAIKYHTQGKYKINDIGKILIVSDSLEKDRDFKGIEKLRELSLSSLELSYISIIKNKIEYAMKNNIIILNETVKTYNKYIMEVK